jgi:hypothetical protein
LSCSETFSVIAESLGIVSDINQVIVSAQAVVCINFEITDSAIPHGLVIYHVVGGVTQNVVYSLPVSVGPLKKFIQLQSLPVGAYYLHDVVHPSQNVQFSVR